MRQCFVFLFSYLISFGTVCSFQRTASADGNGYYRFPTIHGKTLVFTAEGDLWSVPTKGGTARRLTSHPEVEKHAKFSPDGQMIAFAASYEGPTEIYTMPIVGGRPTRVTWQGYSGSRAPYPASWKSGSELLYATRYFARRDPFQIAIFDAMDTSHSVIELEQASDGVFDSEGKVFYFTRLPRQSSHAKRYRGGYIEKLWKYAIGSEEAVPLTADYEGTSRAPMLWRDRLYFTTDRDGSMNLWSMDLKGKSLQQHTKFKDFDVLSPNLQKGKIAFQRGADIYIYDIDKDKSKIVNIRLASDFDQQRVRWLNDPIGYLSSYNVSTDGKHVAITARGRAFIAPTKSGRLVSMPQKNGTRYRSAAFLPKSNQIYYLSDETGETEFWSAPANGTADKSRRITSDAQVLRYGGKPSPDGSKIAYTDRDQVLWILNVQSGKSRQVVQSSDGSAFDYPDLAWSTNSRWLAFTDAGSNAIQRIYLLDTEQKDSNPVVVTTDRLDSYSPGFSNDGKWLYFLSDRTFRTVQRSPWGPRAPEALLDKTTGIFVLDLIGGQRSPFQQDDELTTVTKKAEAGEKDSAEDEEEKVEGKKKDEDETDPASKNDYKLEDFTGRLHHVPIEAGNYSDLEVAKSHLYFTQRPIGLTRSTHLNAFPITRDPNDQEIKRIATDIGSYKLSASRSHIVMLHNSRPHVFEAKGSKPNLDDARVDVSGVEIGVRPADEWRQIFVDAWRLHRDYFYDPKMHAVDWTEVRARHETLLPRITSREELDDLIAMMVGELSAMHTNIYAGDEREGTEGANLGYLGARLSRDQKAGGYRVEHIYRNDPDYPNQLSPLAQPGIDFQVGDIITSMNGIPTLSVENLNSMLLNKANRQVWIQRKRDGEPDTKSYIVRPLSHTDFRSLKLSEWEYTRRLETEEKSEGRIGYFHMRAMGSGNFAEFVKGFYPAFNRQGLIIDMRQNYGGNIDSWILSRLMRKAWMYWQARTGEPYPNMQFAFNGHMAVLIDPYTISDGEAFSEGFRRLGLGPLIGTKTWGGGIWLRSNNDLVDGGLARSPEFGVFSPERTWIIEGTGVAPDIKVDNPPHATFKGQDAQLDAAIDYLKKKITEDPRPRPNAPSYPDKSK
ncbi:MAG: S41 family peptidase [Planctomycetota bacterium]|nr:S41 family peptidase [Planctomycetota bacterium]